MSARGWVGRLSGASQPPSSRAEPGATSPPRSGDPERIPLPRAGPRPRPSVPEPKGSALRVVLVSRDHMLAGALRSLLEAPGGLRVLDWYSEDLDAAIRHADVVIVDMPPNLHERTFVVIDGRFLGRTVVLLQEGEHAEALPPGQPRAVLYRPVQIGDLWMAITGATPPMAVEAEPSSADAEGGPADGPEEPEAEPESVPAAEPEPTPEPEPVAAADDPVTADAEMVGPADAAAVEAEAQGLPVAESGRLIGLSGQELDPVIGPGQVAPGMDQATLERLRGWGGQGGQAAAREEARQAKAAQEEARQAARAEARQAKATRAAARTAAREEARQAKAARAEEARAAEEAKAEVERVAREAKAEAERVAREARAEEARRARAEADARRAAEEAKAEEARRARAAQAEAEQAAREAEAEEARKAKAAKAEAERVAREARAEEARKAKAAKAEAERVAREAKAEEARQAKAARAEARAAGRERSRQARAARAEARQAAGAEARQAKAARADERRAARARSRQERTDRAEVRRAEEAEARQAAAAEVERRRAEQAEARRVAVAAAETRRAEEAEARRVAAAAAEARRAERAEARRVAREEGRQARAERAEARNLARAEAGEARAARVAARKVARAQARQARVARAEERRAARVAAAEARGAQVAARKVARAESRQARMARAWVAGEDLAARMARPAVVVLAMAAVGLAAAGLSAGAGPDTLAGEVAVARAAGGDQGGLVTQDPRIGPIEPLHALAVGAWLRATEAGGSLEETIRAARVPSRFLLAGVVALTVLLFLLLMRAGLGTGAAAGPGPAPPQGAERRGRGQLWRLGGAALAGALVALDPVLVRNGREATGTVLAVLPAMGALAAAWGLPARPTLRWLPLVAAVGGLALLVSPLALPLLAVPLVAELLQGRYREAWRGMAALGLGIGLWLVLPVWVAGQGLDAAQAGWLLGRPPGRGPIPASVADAPLSWLLVAAALAAAAVLTWRHRSDARQAAGPEGTRLVAWTATTAAGALVAVVLGYPADQALPFAVPAAAVSLAVAGIWAITTAGGDAPARRRLALAGAGVALAGLLVAQGVDWAARYGPSSPDNGLARLVAAVADQVPECSAVNAGGRHDRARLVAGGATVTGYSDGAAAKAAGVRYFVLTGATSQGGPMTPSLAAWVRRNGTRLAAFPSRSLSGLELWRVESPPLDPAADSVPVPGGVFSNIHGSACGGHRVVDDQVGAFYTAYQAYGGKAVLGRPLGSVWTSDGPALQVFDTMVLGTVPATSGPPAVRPVDLPPLLAKLNAAAVADADIPLPSARPPVTDQQTQAMLRDRTIARAYLGTDPATASATAWQQARGRFGRPLGLPQVMPDGAVRQTFERVVLELPADGGPARPAALGRLAVRLGLVPKQAMRLEPVPDVPTPPAETRLDTGPLLRLVGGGLALLVLAAGAGVMIAWRSRPTHSG